jgi:putative ABC transport system permease protein
MFLKLFGESFLFAMQALRVNKLRTFLSLLGITIGIFSIILVFTITDALETKVRTDVESLGKNVIYIQKWPWVPEEGGDGEYPWWKYLNRPLPGYKEMDDLEKQISTAQAMAYVATISGQLIKFENSSIENAQILCVSQGYQDIKSFELQDGRYFTEHESSTGTPICLIGYNIANSLFPDGGALDKKISVRGSKFTVIGIVKKEGKSLVDISLDDAIVIPVNYARNLVNLRSDRIDPYIMVRANPGISSLQLKDDLKGTMRSIRRLQPRESDDFSLNEISLLSGGLEAMFKTLSIAGWIIGGFSILVGGFGIANIMFVSVKERTHIIGIQKSLGSKSYFILMQFLVEAIVLCIIGGLFGLAIVYLLASIASSALDFNLLLTVKNIVLGISISCSIGIISGIIPAYIASRLDPVDAIRAN